MTPPTEKKQAKLEEYGFTMYVYVFHVLYLIKYNII